MGDVRISSQRCGFYLAVLLAAFGLVILLVVIALPKGPGSKTAPANVASLLQDFEKAPPLDLNKLKSFYSEDLRVLVRFSGYIEPRGSHKYLDLSVIEVKHQQIERTHTIDLHTENSKLRLTINRTVPSDASGKEILELHYIEIFHRLEPRSASFEEYCTSKPRITFNATEHYCCHEPKQFACVVTEMDVRSHPDLHEIHYIDKAILHVDVFELEIDGFVEGRQEPWVFAKPRHYCRPTIIKPTWFTGKVSDL